ncbi:LLM class flavin-dependent oxidoreductase [Novosphingobium sp. SG707]|uniref:LLM class flavin-dependent oxidoreductase n=1 Tax=Novosphingobium sp. SG707 TaxID=2586996 RepID=UPI001447485F|nr:LLM class flavin-dependent oxidoreductase [Novosphingobium sp. SG707]NKI98348.1 FMN-dependent oxidoreductase (nitrilotriacetate monooxygenase family) [Novosphingobium sp. SG707]
MKLLAFLMQTGGHIAGWRHPDAQSHALTDIAYFRQCAAAAERGLFDAVFIADSVGYPPAKSAETFACLETPKLDPASIIAHLCATTSRIGFICTASTSYSQPYELARRLSSMDHISGGRIGWNMVASTMENEAHNFGRAAHYGHTERYERAEEFVQAAKRLWDSWEDGAMVADKASGRYVDPARLHGVDYRGEHFAVAGPLNVPRGPQGHPVLVQAGASDTGKRFAARHAEVIFTSHPSPDTARAFRAEMHDLLAEIGRAPESLKIMAAITPIVAPTREEAQAIQRELDALIPTPVAIGKLEGLLGNFDLSGHDPDGPLPDVPQSTMSQSTWEQVVGLARRENLSIAELARRVAAGRTSRSIAGTAADIADELQHWYESRAADGFVITPAYLPAGLEAFVEGVVPELQRRGLFRKEYEGTTLRDRLGLARPANGYETGEYAHVQPEIWPAKGDA